MKLVILDYCDFYYKNIVKTVSPSVRSGKFVQIISSEAEYLILSPKLFSPYHADIVQRFCINKEIEGIYNKEKYIYIIHDPSWSVKGGGRWLMDDTSRVLNLFDHSQAYGRFDSKGLLEKILSDGRFIGYTINID